MIYRRLTEFLLRDLEWSPILGLIGPRQVGKTTLAKHLMALIDKPALYLDLELQEDYRKLADAQFYLSQHFDKTVVIDEIQSRPELFPLLRALTDQKRESARFIVLGSAAPHVVKKNTETLAGRISFHELAPFSLLEIEDLYSQETHFFRGGFPGALLRDNELFTRKWLDDFIETFIYRDLARLGFQIPVMLIRRMLSMIAHIHGQVLNLSAIGKSLGITHPTVNKYLALLEGSFIIRRLLPYYSNLGKRVVKSPKIYLRDSGILHHLLRISDREQLQGHPSVGASWEGYVIEQIIREAPEFSDFFYYRTKNGAEVDLIIVGPNGKLFCIEIKYSISPVVSKGFYQSIEDLQPERSYVLIPAGEYYERSGGIIVCSLSDFLKKELPAIGPAK